MKKSLIPVLLLLLLLLLCVFASCRETEMPESVDLLYTEDTELGEGNTTVSVEVRVGDTSVTFTLHTDREILGDALLDEGLIEGETGAYGLYVKTVNGVRADYDLDGAYWNFLIDGKTAMTGVDGETVRDGAHYELVYTK